MCPHCSCLLLFGRYNKIFTTRIISSRQSRPLFNPRYLELTFFFFTRFNRSKRSLLPNVRNDDVKVFDEYLKEERETRWEQAVESSFVEMFISDTSFHTRAYYLQSQGGTISSRSSGEINKRRSNRYFTSIFRTERIETKHRRHTVDSEISRPELERGRCERDPLHYRPRIS